MSIFIYLFVGSVILFVLAFAYSACQITAPQNAEEQAAEDADQWAQVVAAAERRDRS